MKRMLSILYFVAAMAWCPPAFAARQIVNADAPLDDATGVPDGVDMSGLVTLTVGSQDIFTSNSALATVPPAVATANASEGSILFTGNSTVFGDIGTSTLFLLDIDALNGTTVNFLGTVFATTLDVGTGIVNFNSGTTTNTTATNFTGDGTIVLAPNTWLTGALTTTAGAQTGTLVLGDASRLTGAVGGAVGLRAINVAGGSNTAGVSATIVGATNAYTFNLGTNTLNVGALSIANGGGAGVINTTLASDSVFGHIIPTGAATFTGVQVNVTVPSSSFLSPGTLWDIVDATSGSNGSSVTVTSVNPLYTFSPVPVSPPGTTAGLVTIQLDGIPLQQSPLPIVDAVLGMGPLPSDLTVALAAINAFTDSASVIDAVAQMNPSTPSLAAPLMTFQGAREFQDLWLSRLEMCRKGSQPDEDNEAAREGASGLRRAAGCEGDPSAGWWLKAFGYGGEQDGRRSSTGYDSRIIGTMIAYDTPLGSGHDTRAGVGFGYARSKLDGRHFDADTDIDSYRGVVYIGHEHGPLFVRGSASFGWHEYDDTRHIVYPGVDRRARGDTSGQDYTVFASTGYHVSAQEFTITPVASLQYSRVNIASYKERRAGDLSLDVDSQGYDFLESGLGGRVERAFSSGFGTYVPEIHFNWFHELLNPRLEQTAVLTGGGSSFKTQGLRTDRDLFNAGAGVNLLSCECDWRRWSLEAVYDFDWRMDDYTAHKGTIRFTNRF